MINDVPGQALQGELPDAADRVGGLRRVAALCVVLIGAMVLAYCVPIRHWLTDSRRVGEALSSVGIWTYPTCVVAVAALVACGVPRLLLCGVAGMILGFWRGLTVVQLGTLLGYYGVFLFIRWGGRDWALRRWPALQKWADLVHDHGLMGVILLRQLPIHGTFINLGLGLSRVKHRHFLIGTLIGSLPEAIPATLAGAGLVKASMKATAGYLGIAAAALAVIWIGCGYLMRAMHHSRSGSDLLVEAESLKGVGD